VEEVFGCSQCGKPIPVDVEYAAAEISCPACGAAQRIPRHKTEAKKPNVAALVFASLLAVGTLVVGIMAIANGEFTLVARRGGGRYHLQGGAATAFGIASVCFALLLLLAAWFAATGRSSWRQLSWWELLLALLGTLGVVGGIAGMVTLQWDPLIWGFAAGFVILVVVLATLSQVIKKGK
jgi:hypothetical protein